MNSVYKEIFDCSPVAMLLVGEDSKIKLANKHVEKLFKYKNNELIGKDIALLVPSEIRNHHPKLVSQYFCAPLPRQMGVGRNLFGVKSDGSKFPVEVGLNPIQADGELFVMSSVIDITERMKAQERFRAAVDASPSGMLMINSSGFIELVNKKIEDIFGYEKDELLGEPIETLVPEDFRAPHPKFVKSYIKEPESRAMGIGRELFGRHKSGKLIPVEIGLQPIYSGDEVFVISSIVDITKRRDAAKEIHEKSEEIREFAYRTSHDLKTPLLSIEGLADCVITDIEESNTDIAILNSKKIKSLTGKLNTLIEDILTLTQSDSLIEEKLVFNFNKYFVDVCEKFNYLLKERNVNLTCSFQHQKDLVIQNIRLIQVLDNLICNSIKYSQKDNSEAFVKIQTFSDQNKIYIQIRDNGIGIPQNKHNEVFTMFKRFHRTEASGSGLGLYMVRKHMLKLEGQINFESTDQGTTFFLEFNK